MIERSESQSFFEDRDRIDDPSFKSRIWDQDRIENLLNSIRSFSV